MNVFGDYARYYNLLYRDKEYAAELNAKADAMLEKYTKIADEIFESVEARLR